MTHDLILGTAGHIDHGKTSLIRALTGVDTDRLPEEKKRGITIELGFAELTLPGFRLGIVDVPGHERFVRNMLAGATGMDLAMLVVAADDSIKQQTREHLDILRILNLRAGVIAITKVDLVESDWLDLVEEEVRELCSDTFLASSPVLRVSAKTGQGVDDLRNAIQQAAEEVIALGFEVSRRDAPFRMAIDRTFTLAGHGTIVTGSVASGSARVGEELMIEPGDVKVRVRSLQNHDQSVEEVHRGQRAAINLSGIHHDQTERGQELAAPGFLIPSRLQLVNLNLLKSNIRPLKDRQRVRLHVGTAELLTTVRLLDRAAIEPGESAPAQLFLSQPAVTTWNQPFVLRSESPVTTIGGGQILHPTPERIKRADELDLEMIKALSAGDATQRANAALYFAGARDWEPRELSRTAGVDDAQAAVESLRQTGQLVELPISPTRVFRIHRQQLDRLSQRIESALNRLHDLYPLRSAHDLSSVRAGFAYLQNSELFDSALNLLAEANRIRRTGQRAAVVGRGPKLSQNEQRLLNQIVDWFAEGDMEPPTIEQCRKRATKNKDSVSQLISLAVANGDLCEIASDYYLHHDTEARVRTGVRELLEQQPTATMAEIRDALQTTRKYAVPLCEYLDRIGLTRREGDTRRLAEATP